MADSGESRFGKVLRVHRGLIPAGLIEDAATTLAGLVTAAGGPACGDLDHGASLGTRDAFIAQRFQQTFDAAAETLELAPGDVALFRDRLVHRSGYNPGPRHRYSIQARFGDLLAGDIIERGWRNRRVDGF